MADLIFTAYDIQGYLHEALPALKAAIYRGDLSQARDVLVQYDDTLYDEYELSRVLVEEDYSWLFTEGAADPESMDPTGTLVGLTYPLILAYHKPELFRTALGGPELDRILPFSTYLNSEAFSKLDTFTAETGLTIQPGLREGLRGMWEIVGYLNTDDVRTLQLYCAGAGRERALRRSEGAARLIGRLADGLQCVLAEGYGLVIERE